MFERLMRRGLMALRAVPAPAREALVKRTSPRYTLGSVCRVEHDGNVLLVETAYRRGWGFPGGLIDRNERPDHGVVREVREEVGIEVELVGDPIVVVDLGSRTVDFLYRGRLASGVAAQSARPASYEIARVEWVPCGDVVARVEAGANLRAHKLRLYDDHPAGGLVYAVAPSRQAR